MSNELWGVSCTVNKVCPTFHIGRTLFLSFENELTWPRAQMIGFGRNGRTLKCWYSWMDVWNIQAGRIPTLARRSGLDHNRLGLDIVFLTREEAEDKATRIIRRLEKETGHG